MIFTGLKNCYYKLSEEVFFWNSLVKIYSGFKFGKILNKQIKLNENFWKLRFKKIVFFLFKKSLHKKMVIDISEGSKHVSSPDSLWYKDKLKKCLEVEFWALLWEYFYVKILALNWVFTKNKCMNDYLKNLLLMIQTWNPSLFFVNNMLVCIPLIPWFLSCISLRT